MSNVSKPHANQWCLKTAPLLRTPEQFLVTQYITGATYSLLFATDPLTVDVEVEEAVVEGSTLNITCNARDGNPSVVDDYIWVLTSKYVEENLEPAFECVQGKRNCVIYGVSPEHAGKYSCTATNWNGTYETEASAHTTVRCELKYYPCSEAVQYCNDVLAIKHDPHLFQMHPTGCSGGTNMKKTFMACWAQRSPLNVWWPQTLRPFRSTGPTRV